MKSEKFSRPAARDSRRARMCGKFCGKESRKTAINWTSWWPYKNGWFRPWPDGKRCPILIHEASHIAIWSNPWKHRQLTL